MRIVSNFSPKPLTPPSEMRTVRYVTDRMDGVLALPPLFYILQMPLCFDIPPLIYGCFKYKEHHNLDCSKGGLVIARHDDIHDEVRDPQAQVFSTSRIRYEHMINPIPMCAIGTITNKLSLHSSFTFLNVGRCKLLRLVLFICHEIGGGLTEIVK